MSDPNLISIRDKIKDLEREKLSCSWDRVEFIQNRIFSYETMLSNGIQYEPAF